MEGKFVNAFLLDSRLLKIYTVQRSPNVVLFEEIRFYTITYMDVQRNNIQ